MSAKNTYNQTARFQPSALSSAQPSALSPALSLKLATIASATTSCIALAIASAFLMPSKVDAQSATIRQTQDELIAWVDTQKAIAETRVQWSTEKEIVEDLISLLEQEKEKVSDRIEKLDDSGDATDKLRTELNADREKLLASNKALEEVIPSLESNVRALLARLSAPLLEEIAPLVRRLPDAEENSRLPISQRLLTVVGILNKIDKFNTGITITSEIRSIGDNSVEVKTLYYGLAGAYFASDDGKYAGTGTPGASGSDGWNWSENADISKGVVDLIRTYQGAREATFVKLPVTTL
jgi:hypothetical protein